MKNEQLQIKFMHWSDDFEPTTGNKANRGNGIWVSTMILLSPAVTKESVYNTYLLSIGGNGDEHNLVERQL